MPNYSFDNLQARVGAAINARANEVANALYDYHHSCRERRARGIKTIAFCGMGRAGKDTAAIFVCDKLKIRYAGSASQYAAPFLALAAECSVDELHAARHQNRLWWIAACHALRNHDLMFLAKLCLSSSDVVTGPRGAEEMATMVKTRTVDLAVWVENPRVPKDPTTEYGPEVCDMTIWNAGSLEEFHAKLDVLVGLLRGRDRLGVNE